MSATGSLSTYRAAAEITLSESRGTSVQLTQATETTRLTVHTEQGATLSMGSSVSSPMMLNIPPRGVTLHSRVVHLAVGAGDTVTWSFEVSGTDAQGRPFVASSGPIPVDLVAPGGGG